MCGLFQSPSFCFCPCDSICSFVISPSHAYFTRNLSSNRTNLTFRLTSPTFLISLLAVGGLWIWSLKRDNQLTIRGKQISQRASAMILLISKIPLRFCELTALVSLIIFYICSTTTVLIWLMTVTVCCTYFFFPSFKSSALTVFSSCDWTLIIYDATGSGRVWVRSFASLRTTRSKFCTDTYYINRAEPYDI